MTESSQFPGPGSKYQTHLESLVSRARAGDPPAVDRLFRRLLPSLRLSVRSALGSRGSNGLDFDDTCQVICLHLLQKLPSLEYRGDEPFHVWLRSLVTRRVQDLVKYQESAKRASSRTVSLDASDLHELEARLSDSAAASTPEIQIEDQEYFELASQAAARLPEVEAELLRRRYWESQSLSEAATQMGMTARYARYRHRKALSLIALQLHLRTR